MVKFYVFDDALSVSVLENCYSAKHSARRAKHSPKNISVSRRSGSKNGRQNNGFHTIFLESSRVDR